MIFQTSPSQVSELNSIQLVQLLKLLLFAESRLLDIPLRTINIPLQITVADGGEDARIQWQSSVKSTNFFPSDRCIFQVKATKKFSASNLRNELLKESKGKKSLNQAIIDTIDSNADYLVFCSLPCVNSKIKLLESTIVSTVKIRSRIISPEKVHFYDANKISNWVDSHPSVALWLFNQSRSRQYSGFLTHQMWGKLVAGNKWIDGEEKRYGIDCSEHDEEYGQSQKIVDFETIHDIIFEQLEPDGKRAIRVAGPSGYGKSRFAYELFNRPDSIAGKIQQTSIIYTENKGDDQIMSLALDIAELGYSVTLVVDECPDDIHQKLLNFVNYKGSKLKIVTMDIETEIYYSAKTLTVSIQPASNSLLFNIISSVDTGIAEQEKLFIIQLSEGFPQMAILAAAQVHNHINLVKSIQELLNRIIWDKNKPNMAVQKTIETLSMFDWVGFSDRWGRESAYIATNLAGVSEDEFIEHINSLSERGIVNRRGDLRQISPIPLAARLAMQRLKSLPDGKLLSFFKEAPRGLKLSLLKRFQWLDANSEAKKFASILLQEQHYGNINALSNKTGAECIYRLVHIHPGEALSALDRILKSASFEQIEKIKEGRSWIVEAFGKLLFKKEYFTKAALAFRKFAIGEADFEFYNNSQGSFKRLFQVHFCNTEASYSDRLAVLVDGIKSNDPAKKQLTIMAIDNMLQFPHFRQWHLGLGQIGSNKPLKDYEPKDEKEVSDYIISCIELLKQAIHENDAMSKFAKKVLLDHVGALIDRLEFTSIIHLLGDFMDGKDIRFGVIYQLNDWLYYHSDIFSSEHVAVVKSYYNSLLPNSRIEQILLYTQWQHGLNDPETTSQTRSPEHYHHSQRILDKLAEQISNDIMAISDLLQNMVCSDSENCLFFFKKLAESTAEPSKLFDISVAQFEMRECSPNIDIYRGLILGISTKDMDLARSWILKLIKGNYLRQYEINPLSVYETAYFESTDVINVIDLLKTEHIRPLDCGLFGFVRRLDDLPVADWRILTNTLLSFGQVGLLISINNLSSLLSLKPHRADEFSHLIMQLLLAVDHYPNDFTTHSEIDTHILVEFLFTSKAISPNDAYQLSHHLFSSMAKSLYNRRHDDSVYKCFNHLIEKFPNETWQAALPWFDRPNIIPFEDFLSPPYDDHLGPGLLANLPVDTFMPWVDQDSSARAKWVVAWLPIISRDHDEIDWNPSTVEYIRSHYANPGVMDMFKHRLVFRTLIEPHNLHPSTVINLLEKWKDLPEPMLQVWASNQIREIKGVLEEQKRDFEERIVRTK